MKKANTCPYKALLVIVNEGKDTEDKVLSILNKYAISKSVISSAKGTATSNLSDFFGFSIVNKIILSTFIDAPLATEIIEDITRTLQLDQKNRGIVLTLPLTALSSNIIGLWRKDHE